MIDGLATNDGNIKTALRRGPGRPRSKSNPSQADLLIWGIQDVERWFHRDARMREEQLLYELTRPKDLPEGTNIVTMNDPMVIVHKLAGLASSRNWNIITHPRIPSDREYAQNI